MTIFFVGVASGIVVFFNKGITVLPRFKKGLLMYIDNNALIDHDVYFSKTAKKILYI